MDGSSSPPPASDGPHQEQEQEQEEAFIPRRKGSMFSVRKVPTTEPAADQRPIVSGPPSLVALFEPPGENSAPPTQPPSSRQRKLAFSLSTKPGSEDTTQNGDVPVITRPDHELVTGDRQTETGVVCTDVPSVASRRASLPHSHSLIQPPSARLTQRRHSVRPSNPPPRPPRAPPPTPSFHSQATPTNTPDSVNDHSANTEPITSDTDDRTDVTGDVTEPNTEVTDLSDNELSDAAISPDGLDDTHSISKNQNAIVDDSTNVDDPEPGKDELARSDPLLAEDKRLPRLRKNANFRIQIVDEQSDGEDDVGTPASSCPSLSYRITDDDPDLRYNVTPRIGNKSKIYQRRFTPAVIVPYNVDDEDDDDEKPAGWRGVIYSMQRNNNPTKLFVLLLFLLMVGSVATIWMFYQKIEYEVEIGREIHFWENTRVIRLVTNPGNEVRLRGKIGVNIPKSARAQSCAKHIEHEEHRHKRFFVRHVDHLCMYWPGFGQVELSQEFRDDLTSCYHVTWTELQDEIVDCFDMERSYWYGGLMLINESWPIAHQVRNMTAHVTGDLYRDGVGPILDNYWLSSDGVAIFVNESVNLYSGIKTVSGNHSLCLSTARGRPPFLFVSDQQNSLTYTVCDSVNIIEMQKYVVKRKRGYAPPLPGNLLRDPTCSTWGRFGANITQDKVKKLAVEIRKYGLNCSQLTMYGQWETVPGSLEIDRQKFPNITELLDVLDNSSIVLSFPIHPFVDLSATELFKEAATNGYFIKTATDATPALVNYRGMERTDEPILGAVINMADDTARQWFLGRIEDFKNMTNIPAVHFTMGHMTWLPPHGRMNETIINPSKYSFYYASLAEKLPGTTMSFAYRSQSLDTVVFIPDRNSTWSQGTGLASVIPALFDLSIKGYRFPSLRVGSRMDLPGVTPDLSKELYIRTLQLASFLPAFELTVMPWSYDKETRKIARRFLKIHRRYVSPAVVRLAASSNESVIRPMWTADGNDSLLYTINDQFMLGPDILVAPVIRPGRLGRDVYLPEGRWLDRNLNVEVTGKRWLRKYAVPLRSIAHFERIEISDEYVYEIENLDES